MTLPISNQHRACTSCPASISPGDKYGHDIDGDIICEDCIPSDFDFDQYDEDLDYYDAVDDYTEWDSTPWPW